MNAYSSPGRRAGFPLDNRLIGVPRAAPACDTRGWLFIDFLLFLLLTTLAMARPAYAAPHVHPELKARMAAIKTVGLVPPVVRVFELSAGGVRELRDDWSATAREHVSNSLLASFKGRSFTVTPIPADNAVKDELDDAMALYRAAVTEFFNHAEGQDAFPGRKISDCALGELGKIVDAAGVDALLVVYGQDRISTGGRKALGALAILGGVVFLPGGTGMSVGLVDRSGVLLWLNSDWSATGVDLREAGSVSGFVRKILSDFPDGER